MSGTTEGGRKAAAVNIERYGKDFYKRIGSAGGKAGRGHQFGHGKVDPAEVGRRGGLISRRKKAE